MHGARGSRRLRADGQDRRASHVAGPVDEGAFPKVAAHAEVSPQRVGRSVETVQNGFHLRVAFRGRRVLLQHNGHLGVLGSVHEVEAVARVTLAQNLVTNGHVHVLEVLKHPLALLFRKVSPVQMRDGVQEGVAPPQSVLRLVLGPPQAHSVSKDRERSTFGRWLGGLVHPLTHPLDRIEALLVRGTGSSSVSQSLMSSSSSNSLSDDQLIFLESVRPCMVTRGQLRRGASQRSKARATTFCSLPSMPRYRAC
eukprot:scaffold2113_cov233-Pinguiococcus_pyrenoidosus.AAC.24